MTTPFPPPWASAYAAAVAFFFFFASTATCDAAAALLVLPPPIRLRLPDGSEKMKRDVDSHWGVTKKKDDSVVLRWDDGAAEGWEVAESIFRAVREHHEEEAQRRQRWGEKEDTSDAVVGSKQSMLLSYPAVKEPPVLEQIVNVMLSTDGRRMLGVSDVEVELYPRSPAPAMMLSFESVAPSPPPSLDKRAKEEQTDDDDDGIVTSTETWVNKFLSRYKLCPYTSSLTTTAVGLSSVGVSPGPIAIRTVKRRQPNTSPPHDYPAADLLSAFWSSVATLLRTPERREATFLLVDPLYDDDFASFVTVCDALVQPSVEAVGAAEWIGRAWFHPSYSCDAVGHDGVIPGHAIPHFMVERFVKGGCHLGIGGGSNTGGLIESKMEEEGNESLVDRWSPEEIKRANDAVRRTPHATINVLRRSQLNAAMKYEASLPTERKPKANAVYARNAVRIAAVLRIGEMEI